MPYSIFHEKIGMHACMHACTSQMISIISTATVSRAILQAPFAMTARQPTTTNNVLSGSSQPPALIWSQSPSFLFSSRLFVLLLRTFAVNLFPIYSYYIYFDPLSSPLLLASIWPYRRGGGRATYSLVIRAVSWLTISCQLVISWLV